MACYRRPDKLDGYDLPHLKSWNSGSYQYKDEQPNLSRVNGFAPLTNLAVFW